MTLTTPKRCQYAQCTEEIAGSGNRKFCPMHSRAVEYENRQKRLKKAREKKAQKREAV